MEKISESENMCILITLQFSLMVQFVAAKILNHDNLIV